MEPLPQAGVPGRSPPREAWARAFRFVHFEDPETRVVSSGICGTMEETKPLSEVPWTSQTLYGGVRQA